jgi:hypothetical protein
LNLSSEKLVSKIAFKFNLYRYAMDAKRSISLACGGGGEGRGTGGAPIRIPPVVVSSADDTELRVWWGAVQVESSLTHSA